MYAVLQDSDSSSSPSNDNASAATPSRRKEEKGTPVSTSNIPVSSKHQLLQHESSSSILESDDWPTQQTASYEVVASLGGRQHQPVHIPSYEDLSSSLADEKTVLQAVYGEDFHQSAEVWGFPKWQVRVRPPNYDKQDKIWSQLILQVQLTKQYPYVVPAIEVRDVKGGLNKQELSELLAQLQQRASELATSGSVMMVELVQIAEDYLVDHDHDPTLSAWEQMKAREAVEQQNEKAAQEEMTRLIMMDQSESAVRESSTAGSPLATMRPRTSGKDDLMIEKELLRQREALEAARVLRLENVNDALLLDSGGVGAPLNQTDGDESRANRTDDDDDDNDDDLFWDNNNSSELVNGMDAGATTSRYLADFVEMGVLGRGGGGEVVKVKNRLDRRIYAVKKIILESERGRFGKVWALQNRKLRREVTTISRMMHSNIVRYYQAWVEGGTDSTEVDPITEEANSQDEGNDACKNSSNISEDENEEDSSEGESGWWTNMRTDNVLPLEIQQRLTASDDEDSLFDYGDDEERGNSGRSGLRPKKDRALSESTVCLLEKENGNGFDSPLLAGLGFQNQLYRALQESKVKRSTRKNSESTDGDDSELWDESSVKVDSKGGKTILYIQMEYCSTTLRKLIDDKHIEQGENDIWRLVRQILEALSYLHSQSVIHR